MPIGGHGRWKGHTQAIEGHCHSPDIDIAFVYYSDDQGKTWQRGKGYLMGWFNNGYDGVTPCDEPCVAETNDGSVLFFAKSTIGRIVQSHSDDGGVKWRMVQPTDLAKCYSPCRMVSNPHTGDLLCVWNQVSSEELQRRFRRGRLSLVISKTSGLTWANVKTLKVSEGLDPVALRVQPEVQIHMMVRDRKDCGEPPHGWSFFHYANVDFAGDHVYITYLRGKLVEEDSEGVRQVGQPQEEVLRVFPVELVVRSGLGWKYDSLESY